MSMKIKFSYTEDAEMKRFLELIEPIVQHFKVKKSSGTYPYNTVYFNPRKLEKHDK